MGGKNQDVIDIGGQPVLGHGVSAPDAEFIKWAQLQNQSHNESDPKKKVADKKLDQVRQSSTVSQTDQPDSSFGTSMLVAETTGSMSLGYAAGGDIGGAVLGAELHSSMDTSCSVSDNSSTGSCDTSSSSGGGDFGGGGASDSF